MQPYLWMWLLGAPLVGALIEAIRARRDVKNVRRNTTTTPITVSPLPAT